MSGWVGVGLPALCLLLLLLIGPGLERLTAVILFCRAMGVITYLR